MNEPVRKNLRLPNYTYADGAFFVTVCTKGRIPLLSKIDAVGAGVLDRPRVALLPHGIIADKYIRQLHTVYADISVDKYVIMPDHIHLLLHVTDNGRSGTPAPTSSNSPVARFVSTLKRFCNKEYGGNIWQRSYYDHIIRGEQDYRDVWQYMDHNPATWKRKA